MRYAIEATRDTIPLLSATNTSLTDTKTDKCGVSSFSGSDFGSLHLWKYKKVCHMQVRILQ